MNRAMIIGNLTKDPELRTTAQSVSVCSFTVAVNRNFGDKKEVDYIPVVTWRAIAENCARFLAKGRKVGVSGRLQVRSYDANNGERRYVTEIIADDVEFLTPKGDSGARMDDVPPMPTEDDIQDMFDDEEFEVLDDERMPF